MTHALDNIVWNALTGPQSHLAEGGPLALRFPPAYAPFNAMPDLTPQSRPAHFRAMASTAQPDVRIALFTPTDVEPTSEFEVELRASMVQMVLAADAPPYRGLPPPPAHVQPLGENDAADMLALAEEAKPGPFTTLTHRLGQFYGVRVDGRLVAMAGERMRIDGYTEVSAVCTLDAFRGRGYGRDLVNAVCAGIIETRQTPVLHAFSNNATAIGLYRRLGFEVRADLRVTVLKLATRPR